MSIHLREPEKDIYISYADQDKVQANALRSVLIDWFGDKVWLKDFDMNAGDLIHETLATAVSLSKWLIILLSKSSAESWWIKTEARLGTMQSIRDDDFEIVIVNLDGSPLPSNLGFTLASGARIFDLGDHQDTDDGFMALAEYIESRGTTSSGSHKVYLGRGDDTDRMQIIFRRNPIVFVIGWRGIGKSQFAENALQHLTGKRVTRIRLTNGHALDLLCRQILQKLHVPQPLGVESDENLLHLALDALATRARHYVLFLDDVQFALDGSNRVMSYLSKFLEAFVENETLGRILLATTRTPYFPELLSAGVDIYRLNIIRDEYIREIIYQYLEDVENRDALFSSEDLMNGLVSVAAGYPTAAKRIASFVRVRPAALLLEPERIRSFQRGFAESILRPTIDSITPLQSLLLQVLTVIGEPVSVSDFIVDPGIWTEKRARIES